MERVSLLSFAKINLCLYVLGKRKDGYHQIVSVIQAIDLADKLELTKTASDIKIECDNANLPSDRRNLAYQAASAFFKKSKIKGGVKLKLYKKIPLASGLGGGSSNAAFVLEGLNQLYQTDLSKEELSFLGAKIGSDVPFFFSEGQALVKGRGEIVQNIDIFDKYWLVLIKPNFEISTVQAYKALKIGLTTKPGEVNLKICREKLSFFSAISSWENHLEMVVLKEYPIIKNIKETLINSGAVKASMSGSGPTVYGLFETESQAEEVKDKIGKGDWQTYLTRPTPL
ncbi:MAG: 4-(cytidine 5'-diphospho)-2-C-methyl-D-erythritol kinase [candidate division Zixibacteria bacterium]|nr:4-(cytidine 5'-diphospho)-2-C-methyl-D-erythritol kinase [candidate division Zixibacteria bacterium]